MYKVQVKQVGLTESGDIVFVADFPHDHCLSANGEEVGPDDPCTWCDHSVVLHPAALVSRMAGYRLDSLEEAFDAIVREHALRLHRTSPHLSQNGLKPESSDFIDEIGGLHSQVDVQHDQHRLGEVLEHYRNLFEEIIAARPARPEEGSPAFAERAVRVMSEDHRKLLLLTGDES